MGQMFTFKPSKWELDHTPGIVQGLAFQSENNGALPNTPMWKALERRFDLNEVRFATYHPNIAHMISLSRNYCPPGTPICPIPPPPDCDPVLTPEPTSIVMLSVPIFVAFMFYYIRKLRNGRFASV